ncbi:MAG: redoxin domain-containing protein [Ignavibacteria bacterium]|nr:redoxin domain-containing protein [Ignavibacteria bacterium]
MNKLRIITVFVLLLSAFNLFAKDPGDTVDDFSIKNYDGTEYRLSSQLSNGYVVIIFWSTECPYVQPFNDRINDYVKPYMDKGFTFWGVNSNSTENTDAVRTHAEKNSYVFPMLKDENNVVADLFEATRTPEVFIIGKDRKILYHGRIDDQSYAEKVTTNDMKNALDELIAGKDITNKSTKSFGCTIKRINK